MKLSIWCEACPLTGTKKDSHFPHSAIFNFQPASDGFRNDEWWGTSHVIICTKVFILMIFKLKNQACVNCKITWKDFATFVRWKKSPQPMLPTFSCLNLNVIWRNEDNQKVLRRKQNCAEIMEMSDMICEQFKRKQCRVFFHGCWHWWSVTKCNHFLKQSFVKLLYNMALTSSIGLWSLVAQFFTEDCGWCWGAERSIFPLFFVITVQGGKDYRYFLVGGKIFTTGTSIVATSPTRDGEPCKI